MSQLKFSLKTNTVKAMFFDIFSNVSRYYYTYGKATPWETVTAVDAGGSTSIISSEENPPAISDTYSYELNVRRDMLYTKAASSSDACLVVRRIDWRAGFTYDMYDDYSSDLGYIALSGATSIDQANFYALTSEFNVYKCLFNNSGATCTEQPNGTSIEPVQYKDGYIWKFMYTIPLYLRNKFLTSNWMPCTTALTNQFYSNGSITSYSIENKGFKYPANTWKVKRIVVTSGGAGYNINDFNLEFSNPPTGATAVAEAIEIGPLGNVLRIEVTASGSGYTSQPIPAITSLTGSGFLYTIEYEHDNSAYTELQIVGDGYNEENPYSLKEVSIINRGRFSGSVPSGGLFTFPAANLVYGFRPEVAVTFKNHADYTAGTPVFEVDTITVTSSGFGYTSPLKFNSNVFSALTANSSGFLCDLNADSQKNEAELIPLINASGEIEAIQINKQGSGYTYATVTAVAYKKIDPEFAGSPIVEYSTNSADGEAYVVDYAKATIQLNFGIGDIETKQSNVELLAVNGAIPVIVVTNGGIGYNQNDTIVTIEGDGYGATAVATVDTNSSITGISVTNAGEGYTYADIIISGAGSAAAARCILSPKGGHGKDAVGELYSNTIMLVNRIGSETALGISLSNDYRQLTILKNPKAYGVDNFYKKSTGTACVLVTAGGSSSNVSAYNAYNQYDVLTLSSNVTKQYTIIDKYYDGGKYYLLLQSNDNYTLTAGNTLVKDSNSISISSVTPPDFNKYSGEMLYIDNRLKFASTDEQTIVTTTLISF